MTRTLSGLYDSYDDAESVVRDLEAAAIPHDRISLVANNAGDRYTHRRKEGNEAGPGAGIGAVGGAVVGGGAGLLAGLGMLAIPGVGPVVAAGWLAFATLVMPLAQPVSRMPLKSSAADAWRAVFWPRDLKVLSELNMADPVLEKLVRIVRRFGDVTVA